MFYLNEVHDKFKKIGYTDTKVESLLLPDELSLNIGIHWDCNLLEQTAQHLMFGFDDQSRGVSLDITLGDCINQFTLPEMLDEDNRWTCQSCESSHRATKTLEIWRVPHILILSLKRFDFRNTYRRVKVHTYVDFPLDAFDMSPFCLSAGDGKPILYDLYAVSNHHGYSLSSGHYTAYARDIESADGWVGFNDQSVFSVHPNEVKSADAYILFYQLRK